MNRNELLLKLKSIKGPLVALTAFADGITLSTLRIKGMVSSNSLIGVIWIHAIMSWQMKRGKL